MTLDDYHNQLAAACEEVLKALKTSAMTFATDLATATKAAAEAGLPQNLIAAVMVANIETLKSSQEVLEKAVQEKMEELF